MGEVQNLSLSEQEQVRRQKLEKLAAEGKNPYVKTQFNVTAHSTDILNNFEGTEGKEFSIAGRLMSRRIMGKASFIHVADREGELQVYVKRDDVGEEEYASFKKDYDIGDIVGVTGFVFKTGMGEISIHAKKIEILSKALRPLPEKYNGLKDIDAKYRHREIDLIMNPDVRKTFIMRSKIINFLRNYLNERGYLEVDTPILQTLEIGASARPFVTHHNALDIDMFLRIETELYLKRLIVGGFERVYEVGRIFRNEGMDPKHNPEFTSVEMYQAYANYTDMMDLIEGMYSQMTLEICGKPVIPYGENEIDMVSPWKRYTMVEAVKMYSGEDYNTWEDDTAARAVATKHGLELEKGDKATKGDVLAELFDEFVEDKLIQPTFIYEYPVEVSPLAKRDPEKPLFTQRFEYYINGMEMGNAFSELNDPIDQRERFEAQLRQRAAEGIKASIDEDFLLALEQGMPPTGGLGLGVDRLCMLLTNNTSIRDVILFPTMKPLDSDKKIEKAAAAPVEAAPVVEEKIDFSNVVIEPLFEEFVDFETFSKSDFRAVKVLECEAVPKSKKLLKFTLDDGTGVNRTILSGIHAFYEPEELVGKTLIAITNLPPRPMMGIESCGMLLSAINKRGDEEELHLLMVDNHIPAGAKLY
ncbi:MAG: lysine--tRNA ligase [Eubacteriales bacterium]|nr:lysine--tRNA ligase [Eubacteriales bacterium]